MLQSLVARQVLHSLLRNPVVAVHTLLSSSCCRCQATIGLLVACRHAARSGQNV